jgi:hypothetical protein
MKITERNKNEFFISEVRMNDLQENIAWLDNYTNDSNEQHYVTNGDDSLDMNIEKTQLLYMLGTINKQRAELIKKLSTIK